jgi:tetratricopeptide (TPR) repeat protein
MVDEALWVAWLSEALLRAGRVEEATELATRAMDLAQAHKERGNRAWILWLQGEVDAHPAAGRLERATAHYQRAADEAGALELRPLRAHCLLGLGTLHAGAGRREEARLALRRAVELFRDMEAPFWLSRAQVALGPIERPASAAGGG